MESLIFLFTEIDISKYALSMKMSGLFLDPLGYHLLITLVPRHGDSPPPEIFYLHRKTTKLKQAGKFKGHEITAVGWNFSNISETTSGPILLGTSKGLIFETEIGLETDKIFNTSLEQYWRQVLICLYTNHTLFPIPALNLSSLSLFIVNKASELPTSLWCKRGGRIGEFMYSSLLHCYVQIIKNIFEY